MYNSPKQNGGFLGNNSPRVDGDDKKSRKGSQPITPVTIKQLQDAIGKAESGNNALLIDGHEIQNITFVGTILSLDEQQSHVTYLVDDGSGQMSVKKWHSSDGGDIANQIEQERRASLRENLYVRVYGHVTMYQGTRTLVASSISLVQDFNEITHHLLEVMKQHSYHTQMSGNSFGSNFGGVSYGLSSTADDGMSKIKQEVMEVFNRFDGVSGVSIATVVSNLSKYSESVIRNTISELASDGMLYTSIDDEHYRPTGSA
jgi:replication factor A2